MEAWLPQPPRGADFKQELVSCWQSSDCIRCCWVFKQAGKTMSHTTCTCIVSTALASVKASVLQKTNAADRQILYSTSGQVLRTLFALCKLLATGLLLQQVPRL